MKYGDITIIKMAIFCLLECSEFVICGIQQ